MNVLYLTNIPSPYMVDFLNELGKKCILTAVFEREGSGARNKSWHDFNFLNFTGIILKGKNIKVNSELDDQAICPQVVRYLRKKVYDAIVVANPCTPTGIIAILYMKMRRMNYAIQSEGGFAKDGRGFKEFIKKVVMSKAALYLSTAQLGDEYFIMYGADRNRIRRYPFTSLYYDEILTNELSKQEKQIIRNELNIPYEKVIISIGRFLPVKGFDVYIKACSELNDNVGIYIIGGEPTDEYINLKKQLCMKNLHFVQHVSRDIVKKYYCAADLFVLNSRGDTWGLVINEAMSFGLPVLSSNMCYAAIALIKNGENGYIVPVDDENAFKEKIKFLLNNENLCLKMAKNNIDKMRHYTLEEMAIQVYCILGELNEE